IGVTLSAGGLGLTLAGRGGTGRGAATSRIPLVVLGFGERPDVIGRGTERGGMEEGLGRAKVAPAVRGGRIVAALAEGMTSTKQFSCRTWLSILSKDFRPEWRGTLSAPSKVGASAFRMERTHLRPTWSRALLVTAACWSSDPLGILEITERR